jgi:hypothetical protein
MNAGPTSMIGLRDTEMGTDIDRATIVLLRYIEALDGRQFEHVEPGEIFAAMCKQVPDLTAAELNHAADAAKEISQQLRKVAWRTGAKPGKREVTADQQVVN